MTDAQGVDQSRAQLLLVSFWETHLILGEQAAGPLSWPFLVMPVFWVLPCSSASTFSPALPQLSVPPCWLALSPLRAWRSSFSR